MPIYVFISKSSIALSGKMLAIAEEAYVADKIRTSTLVLEPDGAGKWFCKVWVDNYGKQQAIEAHGYPIIEEYVEDVEI